MRELGKHWNEKFTDFSAKPFTTASLGKAHTDFSKGQKVAIKVQRAELKELFDVDFKKIDKFDPEKDGADRDWVGKYEESERILYLEIDYLHEADNCEQLAEDF